MRKLFSIVSGLLVFISYWSYIRAVLWDGCQPTKSTWVIWAILDTITFCAMWTTHTLNSQIITVIICVWIVVALSFRYGVPGWTLMDKICLALSSGALASLVWAREPVISLSISLFTTGIASIPTFVSAWIKPEREDRTAWIQNWLASVFAILSVQSFSAQAFVQPVVFWIIGTIVICIVFFRQKKDSTNKRTVA